MLVGTLDVTNAFTASRDKGLGVPNFGVVFGDLQMHEDQRYAETELPYDPKYHEVT